MRTRVLAITLALAGVAPAPATAQQPGPSNPQYEAERKAAAIAMSQAEELLIAGQRGPESEACKLANAYFLHITKAAVAVGAKTRIAEWQELTWEEQNAVAQAADPSAERNKRLRSFACTAKP